MGRIATIFLFFIVLTGCVFAQLPDYEIITDGDATISGKNDGNFAHGNPDSNEVELLVIKNEGAPTAGNGYYRESMVRFDLSSITEEIEKAQLQLFCVGKGPESPDSIEFGIWHITDDNWNEHTVTWNTAPLPDNYDTDMGVFKTLKTQVGMAFDPVEGVMVEKTHLGWIVGGELDAAVVEAQRTGDGKLTVDCYAKTQKLTWDAPDTWMGFVSRDSTEADSIHPRLKIWIKGSGQTSVEADGNSLPHKYALNENYPNPFNPMTTISYTLAEKSNVSLKIYNTMGQVVNTLEQGVKDIGSHTVVWDGKNHLNQTLPSGVYLYELDAGPYHATHKMLLLE